MTAQIPERLIHRGKEMELCADPLHDYLRRLPKARRPAFEVTSTALWRGYVGTWEIVGNRLWLVALEGVVKTDAGFEEVDLAAAFPWRRGPIHATWVDDILRCPEGRLRSYMHAAFQSVYERSREFDVVGGIVRREVLVHCAPPSIVYEIMPDGRRRYLGERIVAPSGHAFDPPEAPEADPFPADAPVEPWRLWGDPDWGLESEEGYAVLAETTLIHRADAER